MLKDGLTQSKVMCIVGSTFTELHKQKTLKSRCVSIIFPSVEELNKFSPETFISQIEIASEDIGSKLHALSTFPTLKEAIYDINKMAVFICARKDKDVIAFALTIVG